LALTVVVALMVSAAECPVTVTPVDIVDQDVEAMVGRVTGRVGGATID